MGGQRMTIPGLALGAKLGYSNKLRGIDAGGIGRGRVFGC